MFQTKIINKGTLQRAWNMGFYTKFSVSYEQFLRNDRLQDIATALIEETNITNQLEYHISHKLPRLYQDIRWNLLDMFQYSYEESFIFNNQWVEKYQAYIKSLDYELNWEPLTVLSIMSDNSIFWEIHKHFHNQQSTNSIKNYFGDEKIQYKYKKHKSKHIDYLALLYYSNIDELFLVFDIDNYDLIVVDKQNISNFLTTRVWLSSKLFLWYTEVEMMDWWYAKQNNKPQKLIQELQKEFSSKWFEEIIGDCSNYIQDPWVSRFSIEKEKNFWLIKKTVKWQLNEWSKVIREQIQDGFGEITEKHSGWYKSIEMTMTYKKWKQDISI